MEATGKFRRIKQDGQWWLVDPEGYLFWSLGVTGAGRGQFTQISNREAFFTEPESMTDPAYLRSQGGIDFMDFQTRNLMTKYGEEWEQIHPKVTAGRMRQWGLNTSAAWSSPLMMKPKLIPYTMIAHTKVTDFGKKEKVPDPFADDFLEALEAKLSKAAKENAGDPWLLGVFIDNELHWGRGNSIGEYVIGENYSIPAKAALLNQLREKYSDISKLNAAWESEFDQFDSIDAYPALANAAVEADKTAYAEHYTHMYFKLCRAAMDKYFPGHLYLGCRIHYEVPLVQKIAAEYCDVLSINVYRHRVSHFTIPTDIDAPFIISEFHFGAATPGVWGAGLASAPSMEQQAEIYEAFVTEALEDPRCVGAHWFCWADQAVLGRKDGENYRIGFVSVVDRPYPTLVSAALKTAETIYDARSNAAK